MSCRVSCHYNACKHRTMHATRRRNSRDDRKTFGHSVQRDKDHGSCKSSDTSVSKYKKIFEKGYTPNWTTEMFTIVKVQCTNPVIYNIYSRIVAENPSFKRSISMSCVTHPDVYLWRKYCGGRETRCMSSGWDSIDRPTHGYKTMLFDIRCTTLLPPFFPKFEALL